MEAVEGTPRSEEKTEGAERFAPDLDLARKYFQERDVVV